MNKIDRALHEINELDYLAKRDQWINRLHPLVKFVVTFFYLLFVVSFNRYDLLGLFSMFLYPFVLFELTDLSFSKALRYLKLPMFFVVCISIWNPFFETAPYFVTNHFTVNYGVISMLGLICKGLFTLLAVFLLIATTSIEDICHSLSLLHVPHILTTLLLLIYRYIRVLLEEVSRTLNAYALRAPLQKGIHWKSWGSLVGQLLLRSIDRANEIYQSMCLRGFEGNFPANSIEKPQKKDWLYLFLWLLFLLIFRIFPVFSILGTLFTVGG